MSYQYFNHVADVGIQAEGETVEEALEDAGRGLLNLLVDTTSVEPSRATPIRTVASDPGSLLVQFLNAILTQQDIERHSFQTVEVDKVENRGGVWQLYATLLGEKLDADRHEIRRDVKSATHSGLHAEVESGRVLLRCGLNF